MQRKVRSYPGAKKRVRRRHLAGDPGEREGPDPEVQGACDRVRAAWMKQFTHRSFSVQLCKASLPIMTRRGDRRKRQSRPVR